MSGEIISLTDLVFTNKTGIEIQLVLEPEGDCVAVAPGRSCRIRPAVSPAQPIGCEIVIEADKSLTVYLSSVKEIFIGDEQIR